MSNVEGYNEKDFEVYVPTPEDHALQASLLTGKVLGKIHQLYGAGRLDIATHNELYEVARGANSQVALLLGMLGHKKKKGNGAQ